MARLASTAIAGYFPTPSSVVPLIARLLSIPVDEEGQGSSHYSYADPCAGEGAAVLEVIRLLHQPTTEGAHLFSVELESTRHATLKANVQSTIKDWQAVQNTLQGDAFRVVWKKEGGAGVLYLNPPYDLDPQHGRLEEKFLARYAPAMAEGGVLIFLVPFYALKASATTLATMFNRIECFRFPEPEFGNYKQVALIATKRGQDLWAADPALEAMVLGWAADAESIPVLPSNGIAKPFEIPTMPYYNGAFSEWRIMDFDFKGLLSKVVPWSVTDRAGKTQPIQGILPEGTLEDLLVRRYPVAMPPRSAHIAAGIAAGVFNGAKITPDDPKSKLPPILVKGVFDKEFRTVDEKTDKDGNVKGLVQVQQPKLVTTALDLSTSTYVTIKPQANVTGTQNLEDMTMADLLAVYGRGLMDVMLRQCPVQHDPANAEHQIELPKLARPLYEAQQQAVMGTVKLLGGLNATKRERRRKAAFVLGEIGSGKTSVALATTQAIGSKRALVMCPPHLLTSWSDQIKAVTPWYRTVILSDVADVQKLAEMDPDVPTIAILSRETAKLGHGYADVARCGACGEVPEGSDHARKRARCTTRRLIAKGSLGRKVQSLGIDLLHAFPHDPRVTQVVDRPALNAARVRWVEKRKANPEQYESEMFDRLIRRGRLDRVIDSLLLREEDTWALETIEKILVAVPRVELIRKVTKALYARPVSENAYSDPDFIKTARSLLFLVKPEEIADLVEEFKAIDAKRDDAKPKYSFGSISRSPWEPWEKRQAFLWKGGENPHDWETASYTIKDGVFEYEKQKVGDRGVLLDSFLYLVKMTHAYGEECGEPLYQAVPEPRRYPLGTYIARKYPDLFDLLILDEGHEYQSDASAQGNSADRLVGMGTPTLIMSGTIMNGYAESFFRLMWMASADFREEFDKDERQRFVDRYGYRKRLVEEKEKDTGKVVAYGSVTDRVERSERMIGNAPGVLPLFLLRYLLPLSVTLHKSDLSIDIPPCKQERVFVEPTKEQMNRYNGLRDALVAQIRRDRFKEGLAGKLFGQLAELPSYLDRATSDYEIRYPESIGAGLVASREGLGADVILPKEAWMLDCIERELNEGRRVMVFSWHVELLPRMAKLIEDRIGERVAILNADKVPTAKREDWINREIVKKNRRVMVTNPVAVQTGLNNLVHFATEIWCENPAVNPLTYRQAIGRVDRIGQKLETRIFFPVYKGTLQESLYDLLMQKVAVSLSADGHDPQAAMAMAGIGEDNMTGLMVGQYIWKLLNEDMSEAA